MADLPRVFGATVRRLREERGLSQEEFAHRAGLDRTYVSGIERGVRNPALISIGKLAAGLEMKLSEVFSAMEQAI